MPKHIITLFNIYDKNHWGVVGKWNVKLCNILVG